MRVTHISGNAGISCNNYGILFNQMNVTPVLAISHSQDKSSKYIILLYLNF
jgi:hypothetical protein